VAFGEWARAAVGPDADVAARDREGRAGDAVPGTGREGRLDGGRGGCVLPDRRRAGQRRRADARPGRRAARRNVGGRDGEREGPLPRGREEDGADRQAGKLLAASAREARKLAAEAREQANKPRRSKSAKTRRRAERILTAAERLETLTERSAKVEAQIHNRVAGKPIGDRLVSLFAPMRARSGKGRRAFSATSPNSRK